jgi:hypothetical protein
VSTSTIEAPVISQPWDQLADEPLSSYWRFVLFLRLGRRRTLLKAYAAHLASDPRAVPPKSVPGSWSRESARYRWFERARLFDLQQQPPSPWSGFFRAVLERSSPPPAPGPGTAP